MPFNTDDIFVASAFSDAKGEIQATPAVMPEPYDSYLISERLRFYLINDKGDETISIYDEKERVEQIASLTCTLLLGYQIAEDGESLFDICDAESGDLGAAATTIMQNSLDFDVEGRGRNILYIHELQMSASLLDSSYIDSFFEVIPEACFNRYHVRPNMLCYMIATVDGYYSRAQENAKLDPRSVDDLSPLLYTDHGFQLLDGSDLLIRLVEFNGFL